MRMIVMVTILVSQLSAFRSTAMEKVLVRDTSTDGNVRLEHSEENLTLQNSYLTLVFDKSKAALKSMRYSNTELLAKGGGYIQIAYVSRKDSVSLQWDCRIIRHEEKIIEVAFVNIDPVSHFDLAIHYILRADESGFYNYLSWSHNAERMPGIYKLAQLNYALRVSPELFSHAAVDDTRITPFPNMTELNPQQMVMDSTYKMRDGEYYSKYFFSARMDSSHIVHGAMGDALGVWMIMPSHEHLNGGPEHQELTVHQTNSGPVLLRHATAAHYGAGILTSNSKDGSWKKCSVPTFIYINKGNNRSKLWTDAKNLAKEHVEMWPYTWLDDNQFQLNRGTVIGQALFKDAKPVSNANIVFAPHEQNPSSLFWQQQWRGYRYNCKADKDGRFSISKVRPGLYDLYLWQCGKFKQYVMKSIRVAPGHRVDLGRIEWDFNTERNTLWQIGIPDRTAGEFGFATNFRKYGLWDTIAAANLTDFEVQADKPLLREWPFQMAVTQNTDFSWRTPKWNVYFDNPVTRKGRAILTLGVAAFEGRLQPQLIIRVNGMEVGNIRDLEITGAAHRSGIHAGYQEREVVFDASTLKHGRNVFTLEMPVFRRPVQNKMTYPLAALLWDALRLEVESSNPKESEDDVN